MLENINLPLFSQITPDMMRVLHILPLQLNFMKQGTAKRLTPKAKFFLENGKKTHLFHSKCRSPSETFHQQVHLLFPSPPPIFAISAASPFWSCAADRGPLIYQVFLALPLLFFPSEAKLVCGSACVVTSAISRVLLI